MSAPHSPAKLQRLYERRFAGQNEYRDKVCRVLVEDYFARWVPAGATVLDLGCGHCEFINNVESEKRFGMDLNPDTVPASRARCSDSGAELLATLGHSGRFVGRRIHQQFLRAPLYEGRPSRHLDAGLGCLRPGGRIMALGPNIVICRANLEHIRYYLPLTELSLGEVMAETGFTLEEEIPRFLPYTMSGGGSRQSGCCACI